MTRNLLQNLFSSVQKGRENIAKLTESDRKALEKKWDIEHAYYSSALEGSKLDRKDFDNLAKEVA